MPGFSRFRVFFSPLSGSGQPLLCVWFLTWLEMTSQVFPGFSVGSVTRCCWVAAWPSCVQLNPSPTHTRTHTQKKKKNIFFYRIPALWVATGTARWHEHLLRFPQREVGGGSSVPENRPAALSWVISTNQRVWTIPGFLSHSPFKCVPHSLVSFLFPGHYLVPWTLHPSQVKCPQSFY